MARPKSMPDFSALMDASTPLYDRERPRKKPSISLAAGLIMNSESPRNSPSPFQHHHRAHDRMEGGWSDNLFYAYAQKSDYSQSPPYLLTFASASVCEQWWSLVQHEYPESARLGPQLFILKGDDMQVQIQDNPKFYDLRNKWFYTPGDATLGATAVIPLQDYKGNPVSAPPLPPSQQVAAAESEEKKGNGFDMSKLNDTLEKMSALIADNAAQIQALGVAQSAGLQRMQEINETNSTQIKALADSQSKLQALVDQNASHYIALSNASFQNQEQLKEVLKSNADQIKTLAEGQTQLSKTCEGMMRTVESLGTSVGRVNESIGHLNNNNAASMDTASVNSVPSSVSSFSAMANRISPPPRKLNRRIKGVWYEYDTAPSQANTLRRESSLLDTPPKTPLTAKNA